MISRALLNAPFFIPKDADLLRNRKVNTKKRQNRHLPELAFLILGTYFTAPLIDWGTEQPVDGCCKWHGKQDSPDTECPTADNDCGKYPDAGQPDGMSDHTGIDKIAFDLLENC